MRYLKMAQNPTTKATFKELAAKYGAINFQDDLADFIARTNYPGASAAALRTWATDMRWALRQDLPNSSLPLIESFSRMALSQYRRLRKNKIRVR